MGKVTRSGRFRAATLAAAAAALLAPRAATAQPAEQKSLDTVRERIGALEERVARQIAERDRTAEALKTAELEVAAVRADLERVDRDVREQEHRERALAEQSEAATAGLAVERDTLAEQVRTTYLNGRQEMLKLLLSQESPAGFGRMVVYYDYFNRARVERVAAVATELELLDRLAADAAAVRAKLAALRSSEAEQLAELDRAREQRRALLGEIEASLASAGGEIDRLRGEEQRLATLVAELGEVLAAFPVESEQPFARLKGRLPWPVQGELVGDYGKSRDGGSMRWNGVLLRSPQGTLVRAVYHGRVAFADWLPGLGLLLIIDHGDGFMTLYGHNEALLKEVGDWVTPGEGIGQVGDTGGLSDAALYFEIREAGKPVDPHQWIAG